MTSTIEWIIIIILLIILAIVVRAVKRGYFWKDKAGKELSFKEFMKRWKSGVVDITPVQQSRTMLISFFPLFAGMVWGISVTFYGGVYWMCLILCASLPMVTVQFIGTLQKYKSQKIAEEAYNEAMGLNKKVKKK